MENFWLNLQVFVVIVTIFFIFRWMLWVSRTEPETLVGVAPKWKPFSSYEEYREAMVDLDLEHFLERAAVTPMSIKQKIQIKPAGIQLNAVTPNPLTIEIAGGDGHLGFYGGAGGAGCNAFEGGGGAPVNRSISWPTFFGFHTVDRMQVSPLKEFHEKYWYRDKVNGKLLLLASVTDRIYYCIEEGNNNWQPYLENELEVAFPQEGERWMFKKLFMVALQSIR